MSSATTAADDVVTVAETVAKAPRKFPPPCWTQDETLVLIEAYRERWYALRRGYLRTADWDAVAAAVATRCPDASPAKTSAQCRHKMEKLRQRYRAEKQRALSFPYPSGRYFSSWFFFENMEAMENGTTPTTSFQKPENSADGSRLKSFLDQNVVKLKLKAKSNTDLDPDPDLRYDNGIEPHRSNLGTRVPSEYSPYTEIADKVFDNLPHDDDLINLGRRHHQMNTTPKPTFKSKAKNAAKMFSNNFDLSSQFQQQTLPPGLRIQKLRKFDPEHNRTNPNEEYWGKFPIDNNNSNSSGRGFRTKDSDSGGAISGLKRGRNSVEEIVSSIKMLGEGYMKMERAKMEMAREMEAVRLELEMKRNQMVLESQMKIVDAFLKGLFEFKKRKKVKTEADSAEA